jgi:hypothetical protein
LLLSNRKELSKHREKMDRFGLDNLKKSKFLFSRYTILFLQHAQKCKEQTADRLLSNASSSEGTTAFPFANSVSSDSLSIGVFGLMTVLYKVGPYVKEEQAKEFIYEYDSTLRGRLGLCDFLGRFLGIFRKGLGWIGYTMIDKAPDSHVL